MLFTIGHSNRSLEDFMEILRKYNVEILIDVRRWPKSSRYPHFNKENLKKALEQSGIEYLWKEQLGGYRKIGKDVEDIDIGKCFKSEGFRAYAIYILTNERVMEALEDIRRINKIKVIMCSEKFPWNCHRKIISDWFLARGDEVVHLIEKESTIKHKLTTCAEIVKNNLNYK
ncbi:DUF488 domain-containing protein [Saccharolobus islandicus]|uniref:DUF488 domain-containing protein n=7 Tax=Saccharolobus islandicus TaxID=43080 RepID=M9U464_SACIS|nr:DUF488 domain-containing protein [Sulfolobus islandicus]ACP37242.1 protein of unknown function DUF1130 [Sulfolobus islandicus M.14.25]ACP54387.1 protein of unknown function DUF1130 [Sulfolobus islandicus M.16.27]ACR41017.1 protein of unknown function DUF1130 [Sulfolobus islandicus M.16.4]ADB86163.1 protein of unknown function DUF1130 [Sulfolobus islandicus L.D.8.5]ADX81735.1 conserved hypothetical protein [Sulfolobus islandicus HVE10/4]